MPLALSSGRDSGAGTLRAVLASRNGLSAGTLSVVPAWRSGLVVIVMSRGGSVVIVTSRGGSVVMVTSGSGSVVISVTYVQGAAPYNDAPRCRGALSRALHPRGNDVGSAICLRCSYTLSRVVSGLSMLRRFDAERQELSVGVDKVAYSDSF